MPIFDDLYNQVVRWREARNQYRLKSLDFIIAFASGFREYIGAPEQYIDRLAGRALSYVQPVSATLDESGNYSFSVTDSSADWLRRDESGYWVSGLQLSIHDFPNSITMTYFWYLIKFAIQNDTVEMLVGFKDRRFSFPLAAKEARNDAYAYMVSLVHDALSIEPWETSKKDTIGFVPHGAV